MTDDPQVQDKSQDEDLVAEDDAVIGRALRKSLLVITVVGLVAGGFYLWTRRPTEAPPVTTIESATPEVVQQEVAPPSVQFDDLTESSGINFAHFNGAQGEKLLPESMGSGAAFFDFDNDLDPDLFLVNATSWEHDTPVSPPPTSSLYRNDGDGNFEEVTESMGLETDFYGTGVAVADYDADGHTDLFVAAVGENHLFRNLGDRFVDVTSKADVAGDPETWSTSAAFFDYDNDGFLDLFVCNYVRWSREIDFEIDYRLTGVGRAYGPPTNYQGTFSYLHRNNGDGTFTDVSESSGIRVRNDATDVPVGKALGLLPIDTDADGWMDVLVANDTVQNFLFHNLGGSFEEAAAFWGLAFGRAGEATGAMGVDAGYYRNDSDLGFAIGNFANEMTSLYISQGDPTLYADEAIGEGVGAPSRLMLSFGVLLFDYDLDGRQDILQANGHLESEINRVDPSQTYRQASQLFWNAGPDQRQSFVAVDPSTTGALATPIVGRGSAVADIDGDGDLDVVITQVGSSPLLLRNSQQTLHHWLRLKLIGKGANRDALGARIDLTSDGVTQRRQVMPTRSYQSQSEIVVTIGLGTSDRYDSLTIIWPDGSSQQLPGLVVDSLHQIEQD